MENNNKCRFCKKGLVLPSEKELTPCGQRDIKDDWILRDAHKKCWKANEAVDSLINYLRVAKYIPANYKSAIQLLQI